MHQALRAKVTASDWCRYSSYARVALMLHSSSDWIQRTVETVTLVDSQALERNITLDIDSAELARLHRRRAHRSPANVAVPIMKLPKSLLLDLDVTDASGKSLHVLTSDQDSARAQVILLAKLEELGWAVPRLHPHIFDVLWSACYQMPSRDDMRLLTRTDRSSRGSNPSADLTDRISLWQIPHGPARRQWAEILKIDEFVQLLADFTLNYTPLTVVPTEQPTFVLKLRHVEIQVSQQRRNFGQLMGTSPVDIELPISSVGQSRREHFRFIAPPGMFVENIYPYLVAGSARKKNMAASHMEHRHTADRAILYTRGVPQGNHRLIVRMRPKPSSFVRPVQFTVFATALLLIAGATYQGIFGTLSKHVAQSGPTTTILLVGPSAISAYLVRQGEHDLLNVYLRVPRILVVASTINATIGSATAALDLHPLGIIWAVCGVLSLVIWGLFRRISQLAGASLKNTVQRSNSTYSYNVSKT